MKASSTVATIDDYLADFPAAVKARLTKVRRTIRRAAPAAAEKIGYGIPTFTLNGNLVHFAGYERHIGFYPGASGIAAFRSALKPYKSAKGSVQFPHVQPLPLALIAEIVAFRVAENLRKKPNPRRS